jgi:small subunit ribosomal protein S4
MSSKCPIEKKGAVHPGMHGLKRVKKSTDYGIQLRAKQKAKRLYGIQEKQFRNYYLKAKKLKGLVGDNLISMIETRLDNVVYLGGLSQSRTQAKQLISHKHILVNGKPLNISSYLVRIGDIISIDKSSKVKDNLRLGDKDFRYPSWHDVNKQNQSIKITSMPIRDEIGSGVDVNLIIEYYSR